MYGFVEGCEELSNPLLEFVDAPNYVVGMETVQVPVDNQRLNLKENPRCFMRPVYDPNIGILPFTMSDKFDMGRKKDVVTPFKNTECSGDPRLGGVNNMMKYLSADAPVMFAQTIVPDMYTASMIAWLILDRYRGAADVTLPDHITKKLTITPKIAVYLTLHLINTVVLNDMEPDPMAHTISTRDANLMNSVERLQDEMKWKWILV